MSKSKKTRQKARQAEPPRPQGGQKAEARQEAPYTRWAAFEDAVLAKVKGPDRCRELIRKRQAEVDDEANEADLVAAHFRLELREHDLDPARCCVFLSTAEVAEWLAAAGIKIALNKITTYLNTLTIPELRYTKKNGVPGWVWRGPKAEKKARAVMFSRLPYVPRD
jgi:hypothetical protein